MNATSETPALPREPAFCALGECMALSHADQEEHEKKVQFVVETLKGDASITDHQMKKRVESQFPGKSISRMTIAKIRVKNDLPPSPGVGRRARPVPEKKLRPLKRRFAGHANDRAESHPHDSLDGIARDMARVMEAREYQTVTFTRSENGEIQVSTVKLSRETRVVKV